MTRKRDQSRRRVLQVRIADDKRMLRTTLDELLANGSTRAEISLEPSTLRGYAKRLPVRRGRGTVLYLETEKLDWIEAASQYVRLHVGKKRFLIRESMSRLESLLDPWRFFRVHRSAIVNLDRVRVLRIDSPTHRWAVLEGGTEVRVSQGRWQVLETAMIGLG